MASVDGEPDNSTGVGQVAVAGDVGDCNNVEGFGKSNGESGDVDCDGELCDANANNDLGGVSNVEFGLRRSPRLKAKAGMEGNIADKEKAVVDDLDDEEAVEVVVIPQEGMVFDSQVAVEQMYKKYAKSQGFGVIRAGGSNSTKGFRRATIWRCECEGDPEQASKRKCRNRAKYPDKVVDISKELGQTKKRQSKKCFCGAMIRASINEVHKWVIRKVVLEHTNHEPVPTMANLVKEYRMEAFTPCVARKLFNDRKQGVTVPKIRSCIAADRGGYENFPLTENDLRHIVDGERKLKMEGGDSNALVDYFNRMQKENRDFFHCHRLDTEGRMKDILWVDPRSREAYKEFSDVVCFDTTYLTNMYALPFANFVGVNHHGQTVLFGCALISNEDCDTFEWVFTKWLEAMDGRAPKGILTDQAAAMRRPLADVMPETRHRWCLWHILQKLPYKFANMTGYAKFKEQLLDVVYNSVNEAEFEQRWGEVVTTFGVESSEWLLNLFAERHMWVPSFMSDYFWAGMRSTQRVESIHSFFDEFISRDTPLCEFGEKYIAAVEKRIADEKEADDKCTKWQYNYRTGYNAERFFRKIYTPKLFKAVQRQCLAVTYVAIEERRVVDDRIVEYLMEDRVWVLSHKRSKYVLTDGYKYHTVHFDTHSNFAKCSCKMFETDGIMCRHLIRLYDKLHINEYPETYILRRWRRDVLRKHTSVRVGYHDLSRTTEVKRLDRLVVAFESVTDLAVKSDRCTKIVLRGLKAIEAEVRAAMLVEEVGSQAESNIGEVGGTDVSLSREGSECRMGNNVTPTSDSLMRNVVSNGVLSQGSQNDCCGVTPESGQSARTYIKDPVLPKKRGRPRTTRFKSFSETGWQGSQPCNQPTFGNDQCGTQNKGKANGKGKGKGKGINNAPNNSMSRSCQECPGCGSISSRSESARDKIPVKRRKSVSFVEVNDNPTNDDELLNRNSLIFAATPRVLEDVDPLC